MSRLWWLVGFSEAGTSTGEKHRWQESNACVPWWDVQDTDKHLIPIFFTEQGTKVVTVVPCVQYCISRAPALPAAKREAFCADLLLPPFGCPLSGSSLRFSSLTSPVCSQPGAKLELAAARGAGQRGALGEAEPASSQTTGPAGSRTEELHTGQGREQSSVCRSGISSVAPSTAALAGQVHAPCHLNIAILFFFFFVSYSSKLG